MIHFYSCHTEIFTLKKYYNDYSGKISIFQELTVKGLVQHYMAIICVNSNGVHNGAKKYSKHEFVELKSVQEGKESLNTIIVFFFFLCQDIKIWLYLFYTFICVSHTFSPTICSFIQNKDHSIHSSSNN